MRQKKTWRSGKQQIMTFIRIHPEEIRLKLDLISLNQEYSELDNFFSGGVRHLASFPSLLRGLQLMARTTRKPQPTYCYLLL